MRLIFYFLKWWVFAGGIVAHCHARMSLFVSPTATFFVVWQQWWQLRRNSNMMKSAAASDNRWRHWPAFADVMIARSSLSLGSEPRWKIFSNRFHEFGLKLSNAIFLPRGLSELRPCDAKSSNTLKTILNALLVLHQEKQTVQKGLLSQCLLWCLCWAGNSHRVVQGCWERKWMETKKVPGSLAGMGKQSQNLRTMRLKKR